MTTKPTWGEGQKPTPEQWSNWFVMLPNDEKLNVAQAVLDYGDKANQCFMEDHEGRLEWQEYNLQLGRWLVEEQKWEFVQRLKSIHGDTE